MPSIYQRVAALRGQRDLVVRQHADALLLKDVLVTRGVVLERAQLIIQSAAQRTQAQLEYRISELVSLALAHVFPQPYTMVLRFENKRGRTEAGLYFKDQLGNEVCPMDASGYGVVDVAALALRITLWSLQKPRKRATLILDEPTKFLHSKDAHAKLAQLLQDLSARLKLQFIIVTAEEWDVSMANRVFRVTKNGPESVVEVEDANVVGT